MGDLLHLSILAPVDLHPRTGQARTGRKAAERSPTITTAGKDSFKYNFHVAEYHDPSDQGTDES